MAGWRCARRGVHDADGLPHRSDRRGLGAAGAAAPAGETRVAVPATWICARSSMPRCIGSGAAVAGGCCRTRFRPGRRSTPTCATGSATAPGPASSPRWTSPSPGRHGLRRPWDGPGGSRWAACWGDAGSLVAAEERWAASDVSGAATLRGNRTFQTAYRWHAARALRCLAARHAAGAAGVVGRDRSRAAGRGQRHRRPRQLVPRCVFAGRRVQVQEDGDGSAADCGAR